MLRRRSRRPRTAPRGSPFGTWLGQVVTVDEACRRGVVGPRARETEDTVGTTVSPPREPDTTAGGPPRRVTSHVRRQCSRARPGTGSRSAPRARRRRSATVSITATRSPGGVAHHVRDIRDVVDRVHTHDVHHPHDHLAQPGDLVHPVDRLGRRRPARRTESTASASTGAPRSWPPQPPACCASAAAPHRHRSRPRSPLPTSTRRSRNRSRGSWREERRGE